MSQTTTPSAVLDTYRALHPKSEALYARARGVIPGGITHDGRNLAPFPVYVDRAKGSHKWDVDGNEYIDYWMGHGSLFLGHCHPAVVKAVQEQVARGTHLGASHELEVRWAELVQKLIPSAQMVRFTMSGTEATHLALRIARAFTGRPKILKFQGHFHGWHDGVVAAVNPPYDVPMSAGVPTAVLDQALLCPPNDIKAVAGLLDRGDVAAVILEPAGGQSGTTPTIPGYLQELRDLTTRMGVVLIFDEVITGFGRLGTWFGADYVGVTPDIMSFAKGITSGYFPYGGSIATRRVADAFQGSPDKTFKHMFTYSGHPAGAAAALVNLEILEREGIVENARVRGEQLRGRLAEMKARHPIVGDARGAGLLQGLELVRDRATKEHFPLEVGLAARLTESLKRRGIWLRVPAFILPIAPPLMISAQEMDQLCDAVDGALGDVERALGVRGTA